MRDPPLSCAKENYEGFDCMAPLKTNHCYLHHCADCEQPIARGYRVILPLPEKHRYERNLFLSTALYHDPADTFSFAFLALIQMIRLFLHPAYVEINAIRTQFVKLPGFMRWTVHHVPILCSGELKPVRAGMIGETGMLLERKGMAEWLLEEMEEEMWVGKCSALSNA